MNRSEGIRRGITKVMICFVDRGDSRCHGEVTAGRLSAKIRERSAERETET